MFFCLQRQPNKAIPLCLPNNLKWNPQTDYLQSSGNARRTLYPIDEAIAELEKIKGAF